MAELLLILVGIAIVICLLTAAWDSNRFVTVPYEILSDRAAKPCRFVLLAVGRDHERRIREIDRIAPDAVRVAGDMLTAVKGQPCEPALSLMRQLAARYRIYYGMGNHEYRLAL